MDDMDVAQEVERQMLELQLRMRKPVPERTGYCANCDALLLNGGAYCDALCRDDHERRERAMRWRADE